MRRIIVPFHAAMPELSKVHPWPESWRRGEQSKNKMIYGISLKFNLGAMQCRHIPGYVNQYIGIIVFINGKRLKVKVMPMMKVLIMIDIESF